MKYELFYSTGGHGGPYNNSDLAIDAAKRLILGDKSNSLNIIEARPVKSLAIGGYSDHNHGSCYVKLNRNSGKFEVDYR